MPSSPRSWAECGFQPSGLDDSDFCTVIEVITNDMVMFLATNNRHRTDLYLQFEATTANSCEVKGVATMLPTCWLVLSLLMQLPAGRCGL